MLSVVCVCLFIGEGSPCDHCGSVQVCQLRDPLSPYSHGDLVGEAGGWPSTERPSSSALKVYLSFNLTAD